jgi:ribosome-binding protein aMBF1 (putative translation factor)
MDRPSTGIDALDEVLGGGLGVGDNVVWQAANPAEIEPFAEAFWPPRTAAPPDGRVQVLEGTARVRERIGDQVRAQRIAAGLSQAELARRIGVTPSALSQLERGRHGLSGETLTRLWATLSCRSPRGWPCTS